MHILANLSIHAATCLNFQTWRKTNNHLAYVTLEYMCLSDSESALASRIEFAKKLQLLYSNNWQHII